MTEPAPKWVGKGIVIAAFTVVIAVVAVVWIYVLIRSAPPPPPDVALPYAEGAKGK
jgi:hypothetical protein